MPEYSPMSEDRRPTVRLLGYRPIADKIRPLLWGLEEEGIPAEIGEASGEDAVALAKQAAQMSPLNVGIGLNGVDGRVVLHHRDLPDDQPLFTLTTDEATPAQLRLLGMNAARLVKGEPLVFQNEMQLKPEGAPSAEWSLYESNEQSNERSNDEFNEMADLIARIMLDLSAELSAAR
jgi:hypothetical protein